MKKEPIRSFVLPDKAQIAVVGNITLGFKFNSAPKADIYIFNTPVLPLFFKPRRSIVIAHDVGYLYLARKTISLRFLRFYHGWSLRRAHKIVAVSEKTKQDLTAYFKVLPKKIEVIYWGFPNICALEEQTVKVPRKFFLSVGVLKERKNALTTLEAFAEFTRVNSEYHLVFAGKGSGPYFEKLERFAQEHNLQNRVHFLGFVSDQQLSFLYKHATALVFPSIVEGFGFLVFEAFACGLPVIASKGTSLEEIAGGAAIMVDPKNPDEITRALRAIIGREISVAPEFAAQGYARAKNFTWEKTAQRYLEVIDAVKSKVS